MIWVETGKWIVVFIFLLSYCKKENIDLFYKDVKDRIVNRKIFIVRCFIYLIFSVYLYVVINRWIKMFFKRNLVMFRGYFKVECVYNF